MSARAQWLLAAFALALGLAFVGALRGNLNLADSQFRATYCGARALALGADPNRVEPLRSCERRVDPSGDFRRAGMLVPSAAPSYVLIAFVPLSALPFVTAAALYVLLMTLCTLGTILLIWRTLRVPAAYAALAIALSDGLAGIAGGSLAPLVVLMVAVAGWAVVRRKPLWAAAAATGALIEPAIGIALVVSLGALLPGTRRGLAAGVAFVASLALFANGLRGNFDYLTHALPLQARAEIASAGQYGAGYFLREAGFSDATAIELNTFLWLTLVVGGIIVAGRLARRFDAPELIAFLPPAFAVAAAYGHVEGAAFATLALLALLPHLDGVYVRAAVGLCSIPWSLRAEDPWALGLALGLAGAGLAYLPGSRRPLHAPLIAAVASAAFILSLQSFPPENGPRARFEALPGGDFAMAQWDRVVRSRDDDDAYWLLLKLPTWTGFALLFGSALGAAQTVRRRSTAVVARA